LKSTIQKYGGGFFVKAKKGKLAEDARKKKQKEKVCVGTITLSKVGPGKWAIENGQNTKI